MEIRDRKAAQRRAGIMARRGLPQAERAAANAAICARPVSYTHLTLPTT